MNRDVDLLRNVVMRNTSSSRRDGPSLTGGRATVALPVPVWPGEATETVVKPPAVKPMLLLPYIETAEADAKKPDGEVVEVTLQFTPMSEETLRRHYQDHHHPKSSTQWIIKLLRYVLEAPDAAAALSECDHCGDMGAKMALYDTFKKATTIDNGLDVLRQHATKCLMCIQAPTFVLISGSGTPTVELNMHSGRIVMTNFFANVSLETAVSIVQKMQAFRNGIIERNLGNELYNGYSSFVYLQGSGWPDLEDLNDLDDAFIFSDNEKEYNMAMFRLY